MQRKTKVKKYFRQLVPISVDIRSDYVKYKKKTRRNSDRMNYDEQLKYNGKFCFRCGRRFSGDHKPMEINIKGLTFDLCESCHIDKSRGVRNPIVDLEDIIECEIEIKSLFKAKDTFYKKY